MIRAKRLKEIDEGYGDKFVLVIECEGFSMMSSHIWASEGHARDAAIDLADTIERSLYEKDGNAVVEVQMPRPGSDEYRTDEVVRYNTEPAAH